MMAFTAGVLCAQSPEEREVAATIQRLFDAMAAHDGAALKAAFIDDARLIVVGLDGKVTTATSDSFVTRISVAKQAYLERMWEPKVHVNGGLAILWAPYDFHLDGKFSHCGIDTASLVKVNGAWKIASLAYTRETANCLASPLGPIR